MPDFEPVKAGQKIKGRLKATEWNSVRDAARRFEQSLTSGESPQSVDFTSSGIVEVCFLASNTQTSLQRHQIVILGDPFFSPDNKAYEGRPVLKCSDVGAAISDKHFAILLEDIHYISETKGTIAKAVVVGVVQCKIKKNSNDHKFAKLLASDSTQLESATEGPAEIIALNTGSVGETLDAVVILQRNAKGADTIYVLENCDDSSLKYVTGDQWASKVGETVSVVEFPGKCFKVFNCDDFDACDDRCTECLTISKVFPGGCDTCETCWYLVDCEGEGRRVASNNLASYYEPSSKRSIRYKIVGGGDTIYCSIVDSPIGCGEEADAFGGPVEIEVLAWFEDQGEEGVDLVTACEQCAGAYTYKLTNCLCDDKTIETSVNLKGIIGDIPDDQTLEGQVFKYSGSCYEVTDYSAQVGEDADIIGEDEANKFSHIGFGCDDTDVKDKCRCYIFTRCSDSHTQKVCRAVNEDGDIEDLTNYPGKKLAIDTSNDCWKVALAETSDDCSGSTEFTIRDARDIPPGTDPADYCDLCKFRTLTPCASCTGISSVVTYTTDLDAYPDGTVLSITSIDGSTTNLPCCMTLGTTSDGTGAVKVAFDSSKKSTTCGGCEGTKKYHFTFSCVPPDGCGGISPDEPDDIVVQGHYDQYVGKFARISGNCAFCSVEDDMTTLVGSVGGIDGPYTNCAACLSNLSQTLDVLYATGTAGVDQDIRRGRINFLGSFCDMGSITKPCEDI